MAKGPNGQEHATNVIALWDVGDIVKLVEKWERANETGGHAASSNIG